MAGLVRGQFISLGELRDRALTDRDELWQTARSVDREAKLYLHWTAGRYGQFYDDYHINIDADGSVYITADNLAEIKAHTWRRNTGAIGIALACCAGATSNSLGDEPPTDIQIECLAQVVAVLCTCMDIPLNGAHVMTHAEAANLDDYGPDTTWERWDLWFLKDGDQPGSGGDIIRGKASWYRDGELNESRVKGL
ncbi:hypothetical protein SDC9_04072 [bioreactor metagenome]|uniref:N-acetylmuramoyl-L-alanine amidase domain-containing protein n=1 Tax=bioreactor metagenome TaxID=1076179 RepID=A0A644SV18_9ZZZZ|nr:N-acetylmuramoyl-L-alanine amidase [Negativicutes bacterium]